MTTRSRSCPTAMGASLGIRRTGPQSQDPRRTDTDAGGSGGVVLGIDFGTTKTVVAALQDGEVEVIPNDIGARTTPSCVHVQVSEGPVQAAQDGEKPRGSWDERQTGEAALRLAVTDPDKTIRNVKRVLGRQFTHVCCDPGKPLLGTVKVAGGVDCNTKILVGSGNGSTELFPEEVVGALLFEIKKSAQSYLNQDTIRKAVLAVPSYFNMAQRHALRDAASLAGLEAVQLVNETTAAALAYAHDREGTKTVIIVDIGGGGGCVSFAKVNDGAVFVLTTCGKRLPGGEDFDAKMVTHLRQVIFRDHSKSVCDPRSLEILRSSWEKAKQKLSRIPKVELCTFLPALNLEFKYKITRDLFESLCGDLFKQIVDEIKVTSQRAMVEHNVETWDTVLLIGGSTRIPLLRDWINNLTGDKLCKALNPDEAVAKGAALLAAGAVRLEREVLGLKTTVRMGDTSFTVPLNCPLGDSTRMEQDLSPILRQAKPFFLVTQVNPYNILSSVTVYVEEKLCVIKAHIDISGSIVWSGMPGRPVQIVPLQCLDKQRLHQLHRKMERQINGEMAEMERAQAKNALENFLREELSNQAPQDKWLEEEEVLKAHCQEILDQISNEPNLPKERAIVMLSHVSVKRKEIDDARALEAAAIERVELRETLFKELAELLQKEVSEDDAAFDLATSHRTTWAQDQEWVKSHGQDAPLEELEKRLADTRQGLAAMEAAREAQRQQVKTKLSSRVDDLIRSFKIVDEWLDLNSEELEQHFKSLTERGQEERMWLEHHPNAHESDYESHLKDVLKINKKLKKKYCSFFKDALEHRLKDMMVMCPHDEEWARKYSEKFIHVKRWLDSEADATFDEFHSKLQIVIKEGAIMKKDIQRNNTETREKLNLELKTCLDEQVDDGTICAPQAKEFQKYCHDLQEWLEKYPSATTKDLTDRSTQLLKRATDLKSTQASMKRIQSKRVLTEEIHKITSRQQGNLKTPECPSEEFDKRVLTEAGLTPASCNPDTMLTAMSPASNLAVSFHQGSNGAGLEVKCEFIPVAKSNTVSEERTGEDKGVSHAPSNETVMTTLWERALTFARGWEPLALAEFPAAHQLKMVESQAVALAVGELRTAQKAGGMALLLDKRQSEVRALLGLSARLVDVEQGQPVERLLMVRNLQIPVSDGEALARDFLSICARAEVDWQKILVGVSAEAAGPEGAAFVRCLQNEAQTAIAELVNGGLPFGDRVAFACYERLRYSDRYQVTAEFFSTIDFLRRTFAVRSPWFPLLRHSCASLGEEDVTESMDPWETLASSLSFVSSERAGIFRALRTLAKADPRQYQMVVAVADCLRPGLNGFTVCLTSFRGLLQESSEFFEQVKFKTGSQMNLAMLASEGPFSSMEDVTAEYVVRVKNSLPHVVLNPQQERELSSVVSTCAEVTSHAFQQQRKQRAQAAEVLNHPVSEAVGTSLFGAEFDAELRQLNAVLGDHRCADLNAALAYGSLRDLRERFPALFKEVARALVVPEVPPLGPSSTLVLEEVFQKTVTCPRDRVGAFAMLVAHEGHKPPTQ